MNGIEYKQRRPRETSGEDVESTNAVAPVLEDEEASRDGFRYNATTSGGDSLPDEEPPTGSKTWGEYQRDRHQWDFFPSFPSASKFHPETSEPRTTFYARQARNSYQYNRLWSLQHGRGHTYEDWDGQRIRPEDQLKYRCACIILSRANVTGVHREEALRLVMQENLNGFSRYYEGKWGAALGFAALSRFKNLDKAKNSYIVEVANDVLDIDGEKLVDYVWRKYGGDFQ